MKKSFLATIIILLLLGFMLSENTVEALDNDEDNLVGAMPLLLDFTYESIFNNKQEASVLRVKYPVFITLLQEGRVVGCMGSFQRGKENIKEEIASYIKLIFTKDRRSKKFNLKKPLKILLTFPTSEPITIENLNDYDPTKDGLFIQAEGKEKGIVIVPNEVKSRKHALMVAVKRMKKNPSSMIFSKFPAIQIFKVFSPDQKSKIPSNS